MGIVTDYPTLTASQMITSYEARWSIEVFFKDSKQLLGLGHYQNRPYRAAVTHLHLVCFAYTLLTHIALEN
jgi:SRSO17 transposase